MKAEFKIEGDRNLQVLEMKIRGLVAIGWEPIGAIVVDEGLQKFYFQSMLKREQIELLVETNQETLKVNIDDTPKAKRGRPFKVKEK